MIKFLTYVIIVSVQQRANGLWVQNLIQNCESMWTLHLKCVILKFY